jgi:hypothetical protein
MPRRRESLERVKEQLVREQKSRTDRRVRELLHPRQREQVTEISDDSEEENRLRRRVARGHKDSEEENIVRRRVARGNKDQATQTDGSSSLSLRLQRQGSRQCATTNLDG